MVVGRNIIQTYGKNALFQRFFYKFSNRSEISQTWYGDFLGVAGNHYCGCTRLYFYVATMIFSVQVVHTSAFVYS